MAAAGALGLLPKPCWVNPSLLQGQAFFQSILYSNPFSRLLVVLFCKALCSFAELFAHFCATLLCLCLCLWPLWPVGQLAEAFSSPLWPRWSHLPGLAPGLVPPPPWALQQTWAWHLLVQVWFWVQPLMSFPHHWSGCLSPSWSWSCSQTFGLQVLAKSEWKKWVTCEEIALDKEAVQDVLHCCWCSGQAWCFCHLHQTKYYESTSDLPSPPVSGFAGCAAWLSPGTNAEHSHKQTMYFHK